MANNRDLLRLDPSVLEQIATNTGFHPDTVAAIGRVLQFQRNEDGGQSLVYSDGAVDRQDLGDLLSRGVKDQRAFRLDGKAVERRIEMLARVRGFPRGANGDHVKPNAGKYLEWALEQEPLPSIPSSSKIIPFLSEKPLGVERNLSLGTLLNWYIVKGLSNDVPIALNGDSGIAKTASSLHWCKHYGWHSSLVNAQPGSRMGEYKPSIQTAAGNLIYTPGTLIKTFLHNGIFMLDEASVIQPNNFSSWNTLIQGLDEDGIDTQYGALSIPWEGLRLMLSGNFHSKNPDWDAASRYRFLWVEFERTEGEVHRYVTQLKFSNKNIPGFDPNADIQQNHPDWMPEQLPHYSLSPDENRFMANLTHDIHTSLARFSELNRGKNKAGEIVNPYGDNIYNIVRGVLGESSTKGMVPYPDDKGFLDREDYLGEGVLRPDFKKLAALYGRKTGRFSRNPIKAFLAKNRWSRTAEVPDTANDRIATLFHPEMADGDFFELMKSVYVHPALAVEHTPFGESQEAYKLGMELILASHLGRRAVATGLDEIRKTYMKSSERAEAVSIGHIRSN